MARGALRTLDAARSGVPRISLSAGGALKSLIAVQPLRALDTTISRGSCGTGISCGTTRASGSGISGVPLIATIAGVTCRAARASISDGPIRSLIPLWTGNALRTDVASAALRALISLSPLEPLKSLRALETLCALIPLDTLRTRVTAQSHRSIGRGKDAEDCAPLQHLTVAGPIL